MRSGLGQRRIRRYDLARREAYQLAREIGAGHLADLELAGRRCRGGKQQPRREPTRALPGRQGARKTAVR